jgi:hypothetical protein
MAATYRGRCDMSTVAIPTRPVQFDDSTTGGALCPAFAPEAIDDVLLDSLHHEQSIDCGDDAVNTDAALAEQAILSARPAASYVSVQRDQRRVRNGSSASFVTRWSIYIVVGSHEGHATDADLDAAVSKALSRLPIAA